MSPAIYGGANVSILKDDVFVERFEVSNKFKFLAIIPDFELSTRDGRLALPKEYSKEDAVFNISRVSMLILSLMFGDEENLKASLEDKIHQPYRYKLIPEIEKIEKIIKESKAVGHYLSGAGSTIMLILNSDDETTESEIRKKLKCLSNSYRVMPLEIDKKGAFLI